MTQRLATLVALAALAVAALALAGPLRLDAVQAAEADTVEPTDLFHDDFGSGSLPWGLTNGGGDVDRVSRTGRWSSDGGAMELTTAGRDDAATEIHRYLARLPGQDVVRFGGVFATMDSNPLNVAFYLGWRDGRTWYRAKLKYTFDEHDWLVDLGGSGLASDVEVLNRDPGRHDIAPRWHRFELAADVATGRWVGLTIDERDLSAQVQGKPLRSSTNSPEPAYVLDFAVETTNRSRDAEAGRILFDEIWATAADR